ncbi:MAG: hypothetical protein ACXABY_02885 [Candidatus Thorarchaeota archaeon]|jgi:hypothetical protein
MESLILVTEQELSDFQTCPRKYTFAKRTTERHLPQTKSSLQQFMAVWMWTYQIIHGVKCSDRALKEKWANIVTKSQREQTLAPSSLIATGEIIASGFLLVRELYNKYLDSELKPAAAMFPTRYILPHVGTVQSVAQVVGLNSLGNTLVLNWSTDSSTHDTVTNLVHQIRLAAAHDRAEATQLVNTRIAPQLPQSFLRIHELDREQLDKNIKHIILAMQAGIDYPILNCRLSCKHKDICY